MNDQQSLLEVPRIPRKTSLQFNPKEFKVISLRECPVDTPMCDTPDKAAAYWREAIANDRYYYPERECFVIVMLNTRRRIKGHNLVSIGTHDTLLVHPSSVFRPAVTLSCAAIILMHSHPSGDASHSEADINVTRDLIRAGQIMKIEALDHVVMGIASSERPKDFVSLRELGYFRRGLRYAAANARPEWRGSRALKCGQDARSCVQLQAAG